MAAWRAVKAGDLSDIIFTSGPPAAQRGGDDPRPDHPDLRHLASIVGLAEATVT